jgi:hypothetical protein
VCLSGGLQKNCWRWAIEAVVIKSENIKDEECPQSMLITSLPPWFPRDTFAKGLFTFSCLQRSKTVCQRTSKDFNLPSLHIHPRHSTRTKFPQPPPKTIARGSKLLRQGALRTVTDDSTDTVAASNSKPYKWSRFELLPAEIAHTYTGISALQY